MPDRSGQPIDPAARAATARAITADDARAAELGIDAIPPDEIVAEPNPSEYVAPDYLSKTAPELAGPYQALLVRLCELNARFAGDPTVAAQAYLSLTGAHEDLEDAFLGWCQRYFAARGSLDRQTPQIGNDPWRLYDKCYAEFDQLLERLLNAPRTINSSVLNLSQRHMLSAFAEQVLASDVGTFANTGRNQFGSLSHRQRAIQLVRGYQTEVEQFTAFLDRVSAHLPTSYPPLPSEEWPRTVQSNVERRAEDVAFLRPILCVADHVPAADRPLAPGLWARLRWDVYHGRSVAAVLTSLTPNPMTDLGSKHSLAFRRDGWLCHREYSWLRVDPNHLPDERRSELAVNWFVLDTLTEPLLLAWDALDSASVLSRGCEPGATEEEQTAALAVAVCESDTAREELGGVKSRRLRPMKLRRIETILTSQFGCACTQGKGSERNIYWPGYKQVTIGRHGSDRIVHSNHLQKCLKKLGISTAEFSSATR